MTTRGSHRAKRFSAVRIAWVLSAFPLAACEESSAVGRETRACESIDGTFALDDGCLGVQATCVIEQTGCRVRVTCDDRTAFTGDVLGDEFRFFQGDLSCRGRISGGVVDGTCGACAFTFEETEPLPEQDAGSGGSGTGDAGGEPGGSCASCTQESCTEATAACSSAPACVTLLSCIQECTTGACIEECVLDAPATAIDAANGFFSCVGDSCSAECGAPPPLPDAVAIAVSDGAAAECGKLEECAEPRLKWLYGTRARCEERARAYFEWLSALPDSGATARTFTECAAAYRATSCADYRVSRRGFPPACLTFGGRAEGEPCLYGGQCDSGYCSSTDYVCGVCIAPPRLGDACEENSQCNAYAGHVCSPSGRCVQIGAPGDACDDLERPCDSDLTCLDGICVERRRLVSEACDPANGEPWCSFDDGLVCSAGSCATATLAVPGTACGGVTLCGSLGSCQSISGSARCVAGPADGTRCDEEGGEFCTFPAVCRSGRCVMPPDPAACE